MQDAIPDTFSKTLLLREKPENPDPFVSSNQMETLSTVLSTTSMLYTLSLLLAFMVLFQLTIRKLVPYIPQRIQDYSIISKFQTQFHNNPLSEMTLIIDEYSKNYTLNEVFEASRIYLQHKISPLNHRLKISKSPGEKNLSITVNKGEQIIDVFLGINLKWVMIGNPRRKEEMKKNSYELSFLKIHKQLVLNSYLPYVIQIAESMKEANRVVKLQSLGGGPSAPINLNHPSTFDTLAMDPALKKSIMDDLDRFLDREHYYRRVGKAWKRGYLLYGPPGTGKSSLIAAMANYLKFHIYDLELTGIYSNISLRNLLVSTKNRSIIVIEDIDCTIPVHNRKSKNYSYDNSTEVTLSGLLNFIDGLWSSCGDERIIVFTTNYKERLDPALLRPGRMDMHIHMSYLTPSGFRVLARNYLGVESGPLIQEIEELISELEITPAEVAEELMKYDDDDDLDSSLESLIQVLENKKFIDEGFSEGIDESF